MANETKEPYSVIRELLDRIAALEETVDDLTTELAELQTCPGCGLKYTGYRHKQPFVGPPAPPSDYGDEDEMWRKAGEAGLLRGQVYRGQW